MQVGGPGGPTDVGAVSAGFGSPPPDLKTATDDLIKAVQDIRIYGHKIEDKDLNNLVAKANALKNAAKSENPTPAQQWMIDIACQKVQYLSDTRGIQSPPYFVENHYENDILARMEALSVSLQPGVRTSEGQIYGLAATKALRYDIEFMALAKNAGNDLTQWQGVLFDDSVGLEHTLREPPPPPQSVKDLIANVWKDGNCQLTSFKNNPPIDKNFTLDMANLNKLEDAILKY